jgi:hypothetical protein
MQFNRGMFGPEAFSLRLKYSAKGGALSDVNYSTHLRGRSSSVKHLWMLLQPMKKLFNEKTYAAPYNVAATEHRPASAGNTATEEYGGEDVMATPQQHHDSVSTGNTATNEHGGECSSPNSNENDVVVDPDSEASDAAHGVKTEVKEEILSTDEEVNLFDTAEKALW